jgi:hypothetical protein
MVNDLRLRERLALTPTVTNHCRPAEMRYRYLLGVKSVTAYQLCFKPR